MSMRTNKRKNPFPEQYAANKRFPKRSTVAKVVTKKPRMPGLPGLIRTTIKRMAEKKLWFDYAANQNIVSANNYPIFKTLVPVLSQGTSNSQRVGNEVEVTKGTCDLYINILPYNAVSNPLSTAVAIKIWLCRYRKVNSSAITDTDINTSFFETNGGTNGFQGNTLDLVLSNNMDGWEIFETRSFKIGAGYASSTGPVGTGGYYDNSPMQQHVSFDFTKYLKRIIYDDSTTSARNTNLFLVFQAVYCDGSSTATYTPAEFHFNTRVEYIDL